ncbi:hypothetical protein FRC06_006739 [Ceratobasidium sp. 370]|nr:hypothetical protein FRC06_006739 [Ceratobasidium sp. 370]
MILNNFSASIHTPEGEKLPEYETKQVDRNTIECWIPSTEGTSFEIWYKVASNVRPGLALKCLPQLDGVRFEGRILRPEWIATGTTGKCKGQVVSRSSIRLFSFGKRVLTDREDIASSAEGSQNDLNVIRVTLQQGIASLPIPQTRFTMPKENGPVHEKAAKKGHAGSAGLGNASSIGYNPRWSLFAPETGIAPSVFIFRYAPEDWLQARGIIPSSQKRGRDITPDVIDIDDLETDDDEIVVVKHLVPVPKEPNNKRRKIKSEDDAKPKLEL